MTTTDMQTLIHRQIYRIAGFLHPTDAMAFAGLGMWQRSSRIAGSVMEIGVFYGRSFAIMARLIDPAREVAVAADLFDIGPIDDAHSEQLSTFEKNLAFIGADRAAVLILKGDSGALQAAELQSQVGKIRFLSIDGGHEEPQVSSDAMLGMKILSDDGMMVFDDFFNPQYPDVTFSVFRLLKNEMADFVPFLITKNKLYLCRSGSAPRYRQAVALMPLWAGSTRERFKFMGSDVTYLYQSLPNRAIYQLLATRGLGCVASSILRPRASRFWR